MDNFTLITPSLLFSAISLILLAYTNRFLSYAQLVRVLKDKQIQNPDSVTEAQIKNLRKRLYLTRDMQLFGIISLFFCAVSMFLIFIGSVVWGAYIFGFALLLFIISLGICIREIIISVKALDIHLDNMSEG